MDEDAPAPPQDISSSIYDPFRRYAAPSSHVYVNFYDNLFMSVVYIDPFRYEPRTALQSPLNVLAMIQLHD